MLNGQCGTFIAPATTVATIQDPNCSVGYYSCEDKESGCCANGAVCTVVSNEGRCASASASATGIRNPGNFTEVVNDPPETLGGGAKAGLGVGVTLGALLILLVTFCWVRRRNRRRDAVRSETASTALQDGVAMTTTDHISPGPSGVGVTGRGWRSRRGDGDYFGPRATAGPYTENAENERTPGPGDEVSPGQWGRGAVPISPDGPADIVPAVEIGGNERRPTLGREGDGSGQGSDVVVAQHRSHRREEIKQLEEVGIEGQGVEPAPSYVDSTTMGTGTPWTREESRVEVAPDRGQRSNLLQGDAKEVPEAPDYRHELP